MDPNILRLAMGGAGAGGATGYQLWSWGNNTFGQLGHGNTTSRSSPVQVGALSDWASISGGPYFALAVKNDGTLWSWGFNNQGQLGHGNLTYLSSPVQVGSLTNWSKVSAGKGGYWVMAIKTDGTLWAWGGNAYGQLGQGNTTYRSSPVQIGTNTDWSEIAAGQGSAFAITSSGTLYAWGNNNIGQLGLGNTTSYSSPKQVGSLTNWSKLASGENHVIAVKTNGTLWSWGQGTYGQTGQGDTTNRSSPTQIGAQTYWTACASGNEFSVAVGNSGRLYAWGYNGYGQLGDGTQTNYSSPKAVGSLTNWSGNIALGNNHTLAIKTDNTLWSWGQGTGGQLGSGVASNRSSPVQVGSLTTWSSVGAAYLSSYGLKS